MKRKDRKRAHFIQAIRGGSVLNVPSRDSHGVPAIRLKGLTAIYESEDAEKLYSGSRYKGDRAVESESKIYEISREGGYRKRSLDADDDSDDDGDTCYSMTLKEIKKRSKRKKKKPSKSFESVKKEFGTCSVGGISSSKIDGTVQLKAEADHDDLLSYLELKLYKKPRSKKRKTSKDTSTSLNSPVAIDASDQQILNCQTFSESTVGINGPFSIKIKTLELDNLDSQNVVDTMDGTVPDCCMKISCDEECFNGGPEGVHVSALEMGEPISPCKEIKSSVSNEVSVVYLPEEPSFLACTASNFEVTTKLSSPEVPKSLSSAESQCMRDISDENLEPEERYFLASDTVNLEEIKKASSPEIKMSLPSFASGHIEEAVATQSTLHPSSTKVNAVIINQGSEMYPSMEQSYLSFHISNTLTKMTDMACGNSSQCNLPRDGCDRSVPVIGDVGFHKLKDSESKFNFAGDQTLTSIHDNLSADIPQLMELNNGGAGFDTKVGHEGGIQMDSTPDHGPTVTNTTDSVSITSQDCYPFFNSDNSSAFIDDGSLTAEQKKSSPSTTSLTCADGALEGYSPDATEGLRNVEAREGHFPMMTENPPKNLFSTRKAISPTSQEKLCHVLNIGESRDSIENLKCREKLFFEERTESRNSPVRSGIEGRDSFIIPKQNMKKTKSNKSGSLHTVPRSSIKDQSFSCSRPSCGMQFESVENSTQKAIEFSERQMQDIENLAVKLMKELRSMKNIVEETLCSKEVSQAASSKYTSDQINSAIENVARVEGTTKRCLSMMARDCIRFCKIMESSATKLSPSPEVETHQKKKSITFADEDGGVLCHVKVYDDRLHLPEVTDNIQPDHKAGN